jgi:hypothetical protein
MMILCTTAQQESVTAAIADLAAAAGRRVDPVWADAEGLFSVHLLGAGETD